MLEEGGALGEDCLKRVDVFLQHFSWTSTHGGKLNAYKGAGVRAKVPARDQVARGWFMIDLSRRREGKIKFWGQMQMEVEIILRSLTGGVCAG